MRIPKEDFTTYEFPSPFDNAWHLWASIGRHFCVPTTQRELCAQETGGDCSACEPYLRKVTKESIKSHIRKPRGFLTWALRNAAAKFSDDVEEIPDTTSDWGENVIGDDPFGTLLEDLE